MASIKTILLGEGILVEIPFDYKTSLNKLIKINDKVTVKVIDDTIPDEILSETGRTIIVKTYKIQII